MVEEEEFGVGGCCEAGYVVVEEAVYYFKVAGRGGLVWMGGGVGKGGIVQLAGCPLDFFDDVETAVEDELV